MAGGDEKVHDREIDLKDQGDGAVLNEVEEAITEHWGERCLDYAEHCPCCKAWARYDMMYIAFLQRCYGIATGEE